MQHNNDLGSGRKATPSFAFLIAIVILSLVVIRPVSAAPAGTALQFNGTNQYVTFGDTSLIRGTLTNAPVWQTQANSKLGASSLAFNGTTQYVTFGAAPELGATNFTLETWFYWQGGGATGTTGGGGLTAAIPLVTKGRDQADGSNVDANYYLGIQGGKLAADFEDMASGANHPIVGNTTITTNAWHHAAVTYDSTSAVWTLYLDGIADGTLDLGSNVVPRYDSIQYAAIGSSQNSTGGASGFFQGRIDEARIWNIVRTQTEIQASMNSEILTPTAGLLGRWGLNDGSGTTVSNLNRLGVTSFTLEAWIKRAAGGATMSTGTLGLDGIAGRPLAYPVLAKGMGEGETPANINTNWFLGITSTGMIGADFEDTAGGVNHPAWGTTIMAVGEWHHIAATYNGSCWALYLDGNPETLNGMVTACPNATPESNSYQRAGLSAGLSSTGTLGAGYFSGIIDEARVWNRALTPTEILANKYLELSSGSGLIGRWGMNEGTGTIINDSAIPTTENGTLVNTPTWVTGFPDNIPPAAPTGLTVSSYSSNVNLTWAANTETDLAGYNLYRSITTGGPYTKLNIGLLTSTSYLDTGLTNSTTYYYVVRAVDTSNNESANSTEAGATPLLSQGAAVQFDGVNDYVTFGPNINATTFTLEAWVKRTAGGATMTTGTNGFDGGGGRPNGIYPVLTKGMGEGEAPANINMNYFLGITSTGVIGADFEDTTNGGNHPVWGNTTISVGEWHHIAVTYDGSCWALYLDGNEETMNGTACPNATPEFTSIQHAGLAAGIGSAGQLSTGFFSGTIDEARIWNHALTLAEIQTNVNSELTSGSGLLTRWGMNEGTGAIIASSVGTFNGTLTNGPLWVPGAPFNIVISPPAAPSGLNTSATSGSNINLTWADNSNNETAFEIERGSDMAGPFSPLTSTGEDVTSYADGTVSPLTQYCYRVRTTNLSGSSTYSNVSCSTTAVEGGEALKLGNANAYVVFPTSPSLNTSAYTIETWFRRDGTGVSTTTGTGGTFVEPLIAKGTAEAENANADINYIFGINPSGNVLCADFEEAASGAAPSQNHPVCGTTSIQNGVWYHAAATYDGTVWNLYLNGMPEASLTVGQPANNVNISPASLGTSIQSNGVTTQGFFNGTMEEVRIWNYVRDQAEILSTINSQITTPQTGLIARWGLNQNTGTAINGSAGTSVNGTITGAGYSWVIPGAPFNINFNAPNSPSGLSAAASFAYRVDLTWADSSGNEVGFEIERGSDPAGPFSAIATVGLDSVSYSDSDVMPLSQYCYRVRAINAGGQSAYSNVSCATTLAENGAALQLGSANAFAKFTDSSSLNSATFTLETWFRRDGAGVGANTGNGGIPSLIPLITKGTAEAENSNADINYFLGIDSATNTLCADFEEAASGATPGQNHPVCGATIIANDTWYHVAATYDGTTWQLYLNGLPEASLVVGQPANAANISPAALGTSFESNGSTTHGYFNGSLDEVRIWNYARSLGEIQTAINSQISTSQTGLIARWSLNEDAGTVVHATAGTTVNGALIGAGYNWITPGAPFNIVLTPPADPTGLSATSPSAYQVNLTWADNSNNETNFEVERGSDAAGPFSPLMSLGLDISSFADTNVYPTTQYCYRVRAINAVGPSGYSNVSCVTTLAESASALDFGTAHSYVTFGDASSLDLTQFTLEGWFRRDGIGTPNTTGTSGIPNAVPLISNGSPEAENTNADINYVLCINDTTDTLCADFEEGATGSSPGLNHPLTGVTPIADGQWYHAAVTYDGSTLRLYLNGVLDSQLVINQPVNAANISATALATMMTTSNGTNGFFDGAMDEVRIWNYPRTETEIRSTINTQITYPQTGLVARWGLNEGSGTAVGGTAGTTVNGTVTGAGYSWITPGAPFNVTFNAAPDVPTLVTPADTSTHVALDPTLSVNVNDPESDNLTVEFYGRPVTSTAAPFSLVILPDTQVYTRVASQPLGSTIFNSQTTWIVNNQASQNIVFTNHLGDLVETGNVNSEWVVADTAFDILDAANVPYGVAPGNHDLQNGVAGFENWFGVSRFSGKPYYGGNYGSDNTNNYNLFSASGLDFILINLSCPSAAPSAGALSWADNLLATNPTRRGIVVCHDLLNTSAGYPFDPPGQAVYNALRDNPNLFLMLGGHLDQAGFRTDTFNGNTVYSLRSDYQFQPNGGNGWLRILEFNPATNTIQVRTYSPYLNQSMTDASNQFTMSYSMSAPWQLIGTDNVASGSGTASVNWPGLSEGTEYEWYAVAKDATHSTNSPVWSFTTDHVPQAIGESYTTDEDTLLSVPAAGILSNDTDGDSDPLTAVKDGDPTNGTLTLNGNGSFDYQPNLNYCGPDSFTYHAEDGVENSAVTTVNLTVTCVNDVPTTTGISNVTVDEDAPNTTIDLWPSFADVETADKLLTYTVTGNTNPALFTSVTVTGGQNLVLDYAPNAFGSAQLTVRATDAGVPSQFIETTFTVTVNPVNDNPTTTGISNVTVAEDAPNTTVDLWPSFADLEDADNILAYTVTANTNTALFTSVTVSGGQNLVLDYAPNANGSAQITVRATDLGGLFIETSFTVTVTPVNDAPVCVDMLATTLEDTAVQSDPLCTDADGDALTFNIVAQPLNGTASVVAGKLVYTPKANYSGPDSYTYTANDTTVDGNTATANVTVTSVNDAPVAAPQSLTTPEDTALSITLSGTDAENDPLTYIISTFPANGTLSGTAPAIIYTPNANYNGPDSFTFQVNDGELDSVPATISITVTPVNDAPVATGESYTTAEDTALNIAAPGVLGNDTDLENNSLTAVKVADPTNGTITLNANGSFTYTPSANYNGADSFTYKANDGTTDSNIVTVNITITTVNDAPNANPQSATTAEDTSTNITLTGLDIEGSALTFAIVTPPVNGSLSGAEPNITYTPNANYNGPDSFTFRVNDGNLDSTPATVSITVTPVNDAPIAIGESYTTAEDTALNIAAPGVLSNDTDLDGNPLTTIKVTDPANGTVTLNANGSFTYMPVPFYNGPDSFTYKANDGTADSNTVTVNINVSSVNNAPVCSDVTLTTNEDTTGQTAPSCTDPDGDTLAYSIVTQPANGTASILAGQLVYAPNGNFNGTDSFTYRASDNVLDSNISTVTVTVVPVNDAPIATPQGVTTAEDTSTSITLTGTDIEGNVLTFAIVTSPANGSLSGTEPNLTYTPNANYNGPDSFTFRVNDGNLDSTPATVSITVTPVNDAPVATPQTVTTSEDVALNITLTGTDLDGDALTFSVVTPPTNGILSGMEPNIVYTPNANYNGPDSFTFIANDATVNSAAATVSITVTAANDAPVAISESYTTAEDTALAISAPGVLSNDTDVDGDPLTAVIVTGPANGTLTLNTNGSFNYAPNANVNGPDSFTYHANDSTANSNIATVNIMVTAANDAPVFTSTPVLTAQQGTGYIYNITTTDSDLGDVLMISAPVLPAWLTITDNGSGTATLSGTPSNADVGSNSVTVRVSDGTASTDQTFVIAVNNTNDAPSFTSMPVITATEDSPYIYNITATDPDLSDALTITGPVLPAWLTLTDNGDGTAALSGAPTNANVGINNITLLLSDGTASVNQVFAITVANTNDVPTDIAISNNIVNEGQPIDSLIGTFTTTDPDLGDTFTYSFCGGPDDGSFQFSGNALQTAVVFDAELQSAFIICIHSQDAGGLFFEKQLTITVNNVNDAPVVTLQSISKNVNESSPLFFNNANSTLITVSDPDAGAASLQVTLGVTQGTLTLGSTGGLTITPPADGAGDASITFIGTLANINAALDGMRYDPPAGYNGGDTLQIAVDDLGNSGTGGNQTANASMDFTMLALPPKVTANGINTIPAHDNADLAEWEVLAQGYSQFTVVFDQDVLNAPASDTTNYINSVINPQNYLLVRDNGDSFQTRSCANKVDSFDTSININSVTYSNNGGIGPFIATLNINDGLPLAYGNYRLFICGTTSITDPFRLKLAGDGVNAGTDMTRSFIIVNTSSTGGGSGNAGGNGGESTIKQITGALIPVTGFTPNRITDIPAQGDEDAYDAKSSLHLEIPRLAFDQPIVGIQFKNKGWDVKWLDNDIGYLEGSAYPTWTGNTVLTGHSTDANGNAITFAHIRELVVGDKIIIHSNGFIYIYRVEENRLILPTSIEILFKHEEYSWITLVTCENYNADSGKYTSRRMVRAVLISVISEK